MTLAHRIDPDCDVPPRTGMRATDHEARMKAIFAEPVRPVSRMGLDEDELRLLLDALEQQVGAVTDEEAALAARLLNALDEIRNPEERR